MPSALGLFSFKYTSTYVAIESKKIIDKNFDYFCVVHVIARSRSHHNFSFHFYFVLVILLNTSAFEHCDCYYYYYYYYVLADRTRTLAHSRTANDIYFSVCFHRMSNDNRLARRTLAHQLLGLFTGAGARAGRRRRRRSCFIPLARYVWLIVATYLLTVFWK